MSKNERRDAKTSGNKNADEFYVEFIPIQYFFAILPIILLCVSAFWRFILGFAGEDGVMFHVEHRPSTELQSSVTLNL